MYYASYPADTLTQVDTTSYQIRPNAWWLVLLYQGLVMTLPALKLGHVAAVNDWSWYWVTLPIWAPSVLLAAVLGVEQLVKIGKPSPASPAHRLGAETSAAS